QKALKIGSDFAQVLYYKNHNLINISFQLHNEKEFLEILKNNIVNDAPALISHIQWDKCRMDAVIKTFNNILRPNIESWLIEKLEVNAERWMMEQCMLNLEKKINIKPFRTLEM